MAENLDDFTVDLKVHVGPLRFLRAEVSEQMALIHYELNGQEPETGLRLDLDKQAFLDPSPEGSEEESALAIALPLFINI